MRLFGRKKRVLVRVKFCDVETGKVFAQSQMSADQLPQSFEATTTLHLENGDWSVVEASPMTASAFLATGELFLVLRKVTTGTFEMATVLFTVPSVANDALPPTADETSKLGAHVLDVLEDDWRQIEWLPASVAHLIEPELDSVRRIIENERMGQGFRKCHTRAILPMLLPTYAVPLSTLQAAIKQPATWLAGFAYHGIAGIVGNSFAVRLASSIELFGIAPDGIIAAICFANTRMNTNVPHPDVQDLVGFAADHDLLLVDWCRTRVLEPSLADYEAYFNRNDVEL